VQVEAWIDGDGLPARIKLSAHPTFSMAIDIVAYDVPVDVLVPASSIVVEEAEFDEFNGSG
jgi:hypothetical protein